MRFYILNYDCIDDEVDGPYIELRYGIHDNPGFLDLNINYEVGKTCIELILKALCKLYKTDEIIVFYKRYMYKTCNG